MVSAYYQERDILSRHAGLQPVSIHLCMWGRWATHRTALVGIAIVDHFPDSLIGVVGSFIGLKIGHAWEIAVKVQVSLDRELLELLAVLHEIELPTMIGLIFRINVDLF